MDPNILDLILALVVLFAAFSGWRRGALAQIATFVGAVGGVVLGAAYAPSLASRFAVEPGVGLAALTLVGVLLAFLLGQTVGAMLGARLRRGAARIGIGPVDSLLGLGVAVAGVLIAAWLLASALTQGPSQSIAAQIQGSEVLTRLDDALPDPPDVVNRAGTFLDSRGFPQVSTGIGAPVGPPVDDPEDGDVRAAVDAAADSVVRVESQGCGRTSQGSGFVTVAGHVVTNAHVIAGGDDVSVAGVGGTHEATAVAFDPATDLAVLRVPDLDAPGVPWVEEPAERETTGATLGFAGGSRDLITRSATVSTRQSMIGRDIYGDDPATREVLTVTAGVERGDSGGPFVTREGRVGGVVFAASTAQEGHGYALSAESVRDAVARAVDRPDGVSTGDCRVAESSPVQGAPAPLPVGR
ncbi:MarP family serine protease [Egibacter rhizosphaerae]|uniref:MarP family serine protease n=1 Tax=Egibacter rhizosphaerae TaxID=1670831 RepID=A0A411YAK5_9ACTN|nr:MarP family serine protease [Egibacter rhizosphaerae]QBI18253.1 MarP family serine protease [Egibacter rhizosphaerae]